MSLLGRQFIAGVAEHLPALVALTAPSWNSYRRLQPSAWASATTAWGFDNKEAALRVASPFYRREEQSYNIEFKSCDASANPYLALGALIAAGVDGVARRARARRALPSTTRPGWRRGAGAQQGPAAAVQHGRRAGRAGEGRAAAGQHG